MNNETPTHYLDCLSYILKIEPIILKIESIILKIESDFQVVRLKKQIRHCSNFTAKMAKELETAKDIQKMLKIQTENERKLETAVAVRNDTLAENLHDNELKAQIEQDRAMLQEFVAASKRQMETIKTQIDMMAKLIIKCNEKTELLEARVDSFFRSPSDDGEEDEEPKSPTLDD